MPFSLMLISFLLFCNVIISKDTKKIINKTYSKTQMKIFNLKMELISND